MLGTTHTAVDCNRRFSARPILLPLLAGLLLFASPAMAKPKGGQPWPLESARINEHLTPSTQMGVLPISVEKAQSLLAAGAKSQLFSHITGGAPLAEGPVSVAGLDMKTLKNKEAPFAPDLTAAMDGEKVVVKLFDGSEQWPGNEKDPILSVHAVSHGTYVAGNRTLVTYMERAQKASSHPAVLVASNSELLFAHSTMVLLSKTEEPNGLGGVHTTTKYGYRTQLLRVNASQITTDSLDTYQPVLAIEPIGKGIFSTNLPYVWLLPVKEGALDNSRFGYKVSIGFLESNVKGVPGVFKQTQYATVGMVTRVRIEGGAPVLPTLSPTAAQPTPATAAAPTTADSSTPATPSPVAPPAPAAGTIEPGSDADPLLTRRGGPNDPTTWGVTASLGGGLGFEVVNKDLGAAIPGSIAGWYGPVQVGFDSSLRANLASVGYRFGSERDVNASAGGLAIGSYRGNVAVGPQYTASGQRTYWGLDVIQAATINLALGKSSGILVNQSLSFRLPAGDGVFVLPGAFLNFGLGFQKSDSDGVLDAQLGLQVKIAVNGNAP